MSVCDERVPSVQAKSVVIFAFASDACGVFFFRFLFGFRLLFWFSAWKWLIVAAFSLVSESFTL